MNILLINPKSYENAFTAEPLGLMYLDSAINKAGFKSKCLDLNFKEDNNKLIDMIEKTKVFAITCYTDNRENVIQLAEDIKKIRPSSTIILGGHHPTFLAEEMLTNYDIDIIIRGEGEDTFIEYLKYIQVHGKLSVNKIKGLSYKINNEIIHNPDRELIFDISKLPWPKRLPNFENRYKFYRQYFDLYEFNKIPSEFKAAGVITSRGCSYNCIYCSIQKFWKNKVRYREINDVINEIEYLKKEFGINFIFIWDDVFTLNKERVIEFCDLMKKRKLNIMWACITRVDLVNEELIKQMKESGCVLISYGVESANTNVLSKISKKISKEKVINTIDLTKNYGIDTRISLLVGSPGESQESINETVELVRILKPTAWSVNILRIYPNTDLCNELIHKGKFNNDYWQQRDDIPYYKEELTMNFLLKYKFELENALSENILVKDTE